MDPWDVGAAARLGQITRTLDSLGVVDFLREEITQVWCRNVERYDPDGAGDTLLSLGIQSAENINSRVARRCLPPSGLAAAGVNVSLPDHSLLIEAGGIEIHVMKVPGDQIGAPDWHGDFRWGSSSETRRRCAERNSAMYRVPAAPHDSLTLFTLPEEVSPGRADAGGCSDVFLVWSGSMDGLTAGWLGLPRMGGAPWMAVRQLWSDQMAVAGSLSR